MGYPRRREMDGIYFRVFRHGEWDSVCFTDLTEDEMYKVLEGKSEMFLKKLAIELADVFRDIIDNCELMANEYYQDYL